MRVRPRFELTSPLSPEAIGACVKERLADEDCRLSGLVLPGRIEITVCAEDQHLWSPQLTVDVTTHDEGSRMCARFGPHAHVWTMYVALYAAVLCVFLAALVGGSAQLTLGRPPWAFWGIAITPAAAGLLWLLAVFGQRFGHDQMDTLRVFLETCARSS